VIRRVPVDLFDPAHYATVRQPVGEAETLPAWCYTSPEFYAREVERIFTPGWHFVGRADEVAEPGSYLAVDTVPGPLLLLRDQAGRLGAFANTCRHRGARLLQGGGRCRTIVCPYHAWTYGPDGGLLNAPGMRDRPGFDRADWGLAPVRCETWQGFVFVSVDPAGPGLVEHFGDLAEKLGGYDFDRMVCVRRIDYEVACNWKLLVENAMEEYHTGTVHHASLGQQHALQEETRGHWDAIFIPQETSIAVLPGETPPFPPLPGLTGRPAHGTYFTILHPATQLACTQDAMWWLRVLPLGPARSRLGVGFAFPRTTVARPDFAEGVKRYFHRWETGIGEDNAICEAQQAGLASALRRPGPFALGEPAVHRVNNWVLDQVLDGPGRRRAVDYFVSS
jgi:phenylpropionate dioxygenase-like ring-hydroxylating dioxygenase large terminal subunit